MTRRDGDFPTRREALAMGLAGVGMVGMGAVVAASRGSDGDSSTGAASGTRTAAEWTEPAVLESSEGVLDLELTVAETTVAIAGATATMLTYNGTVPGPTLHVRPGDTLRVRLVNGLSEVTNLHTHGLAVSATGASDNPFRRVEPGESFDYVIDIPADHPHGVAWYHPHHHGHVADQVFGGLYGALVVDEDDWSDGAPRVVVVSDVTLSGGAVANVSAMERRMGRVGETLLTNGARAPQLPVAPGTTERLLLVNACTSRYLSLGGPSLTVRSVDIGGLARPVPTDSLVVPPGGRADLQVDAPASSTALVARAYARGAGMGMMGAPDSGTDATILTLVPDASAASPATPGDASAPVDLRDATVAREREITFTMGMGGMGGMSFLIDGREFDPERVDQSVRLGAVEDWTLVNATGMDHPFHLHVWPMQLIDSDEVEVRDVVDVPAGQRVRVRIAFDRFAGPTVYHCHILDHEDLGMMGVVEAS